MARPGRNQSWRREPKGKEEVKSSTDRTDARARMKLDELRPIPGFEGIYSVTEDGRVWSHTRAVRGKCESLRLLKGRWLKPSKDTCGYPLVTLRSGNRDFPMNVHRAVALAWLPNPLGARTQFGARKRKRAA